MITTREIRDYLKNEYNFGFEKYQVGEMVSDKEKQLYLYDVADPDENQTPTIHFTKTIMLYIHWNNDENETYEKTMEIYKALFRKCKFVINGKMISYIIVDLPIDEYKDKYNIYNRSIKIKFVE